MKSRKNLRAKKDLQVVFNYFIQKAERRKFEQVNKINIEYK